MADNTAQGGNATIAADDVTTLNGGASSGVLVQRMKVAYGDDGTSRDTSAAFPLPTATPNATATGTITAAGQSVALAVPDNHSSYTIGLSGTFSAGTTLIVEGTIDGTNWFPTNVRQNLAAGINEQMSLVTTDISGGSNNNPSMWKGTAGGVTQIRVRCSVYTASDSVAVRIMSSAGVGGTFLLGGISDMRGTALANTSGTIAAAGTGTVGPLDVSRQGNVSFIVKNSVAASPFAGAPVIVFEQSDDNAQWAPLMVVNNSNGFPATTHTLGPNTASTEVVFEAPVESVNYVRARVTTGPTTNGMTIVIQAGSLPFVPVVTSIDRKDAARTAVNLYAANVTAGTTATEALVSLTIAQGVAATTTGTTYAIPSGKTLRITGIRFQHVAGAATANSVVWRLRVNTAGAVTLTSTPITVSSTTRAPATAGAVATYDIPIGEGYEIPNATGTTNIGFTVTPTWTTTALTYDLHVVGYLY